MKSCYLSVVAAACVVGQLSAQTLSNYQATVASQSPSDYFKLDGSWVSAVNPGVTLGQFAAGGGYTYDVFGNPANSFFFQNQSDEIDNVTDPLINGGGTANTNSTAKGSISFLFRTLSDTNNTGQRYLFSAGKDTSTTNAFALFVENSNSANGDPNSLKLRFMNNTTTILQREDLKPSTWFYFALTYDETSTVVNKGKWFVGPAGGVLTTGMTTNAAAGVAGEGVDAGAIPQKGLFLGNSNEADDGFRNPGSGRIDEFAIWARELSPTEISNQFAALPAAPSGVVVTNVIVDDSFADGNRTNTGPLQASWWSSTQASGLSVEAYTNQLGLVSGTSGRGLHGTFAPQTLGIGDTIRATYTFTTPDTVGVSRSTALKVAMMDFNNTGLAADLDSSSGFAQPLYFNLPGYMSDFDVNTGVTADTNVRKHNTNTTGRLTSTTSEWTSLGGSPDAGYAFTANTEYVGVYSITRTDFDSVDITSSMSQGATLMDSTTQSDSSSIANNYGVLAFAVGSSTFGSTNGPGELLDNGITFSNIKVEVVTPSTEAPAINITAAGSDVVLSWLTAGSSGYSLESTPSLTAPITWSSNGPPAVVVGDSYVVTNSAAGAAKYYRLAN